MAELTDAVTDLVHDDTQVTDAGIDLTLDTVAHIQEPAQLDFGDNELTTPTTRQIDPDRRHPDDDYGWWELDAGTYLITHNESLDTDTPIHLEPRTALTTRGATHPTLDVTTLDPLPLTTGGIHLKENARISTVRPPTRP